VSVLDSIIEGVREDLAARRLPLAQINEALSAAPNVIDVHPRLLTEPMNIIAEVKRSSPSKGVLGAISNPVDLAQQYQEAGAVMVSVLTERRRFNGSLEDLVAVRAGIDIPLLRKEFMVDEYQFLEARAAGADAVLLIVAALSKSQLKDYFDLATELGMASLVEVHTPAEIEDALEIDPRIIGVNCRNLKTLDLDKSAFTTLIPQIPKEIIRIAESGISMRSEVVAAQEAGARAILVGETLVRAGDPAKEFNALIASNGTITVRVEASLGVSASQCVDGACEMLDLPKRRGTVQQRAMRCWEKLGCPDVLALPEIATAVIWPTARPSDGIEPLPTAESASGAGSSSSAPAAGSSSQVAPVAPVPWSCGACTFFHESPADMGFLACALCATPKP
jgi:indole-3-glycerol phosphate synthase